MTAGNRLILSNTSHYVVRFFFLFEDKLWRVHSVINTTQDHGDLRRVVDELIQAYCRTISKTESTFESNSNQAAILCFVRRYCYYYVIFFEWFRTSCVSSWSIKTSTIVRYFTMICDLSQISMLEDVATTAYIVYNNWLYSIRNLLDYTVPSRQTCTALYVLLLISSAIIYVPCIFAPQFITWHQSKIIF